MKSFEVVFTALILILIIILPVFLIQQKSKRRKKKIKDLFLNFCGEKAFQINKIIERDDRIAALDSKNSKLIVANFDKTLDPNTIRIFNLMANQKDSLKVEQRDKEIRKVSLSLNLSAGSEKKVEVIFYDWTKDNIGKAEIYLHEAKDWETLLSSGSMRLEA